MYVRSRRRIPVTAWLIPILIVFIVVAAIVFDYREQHRTFSVFGTPIDAHNIRQVLVQPSPNNRTHPQVYKISAYSQVISILNVLSQSTPVQQKAVLENNTVLDNMFVEFKNGSWELNLLQTPLSNHLYVQYNGKLFKTSAQIVQAIKKQP